MFSVLFLCLVSYALCAVNDSSVRVENARDGENALSGIDSDSGNLIFPQKTDGSKGSIVSLIILHNSGTCTAAKYSIEGGIDKSSVQITNSGMNQSEQLGRLLRSEYVGFIPQRYDSAQIKSFASNVIYTQRAAYALLYGLFPQTSGTAVRMEDQSLKLAIRPYENLPAFILHQPQHVHTVLQDLNESVSQFFSRDELEMLDVALKSGTFCQEPESSGLCILYAYDTILFLQSESKECPAVLCEANVWEKIGYHWRKFKHDFLLFFPNSTFQKEYIPSLGGPLAEKLIQYMRGDEQKGVKMRHLSVPSDTLTVLYHTLGLIESQPPYLNYHNPSPSECVVFEVYQGGTFRVKRIRLKEAQSEVTDSSFVIDLLDVQCKNSKESDCCLINGWDAIVGNQYSLPHGNDICFASPNDHKTQGCTAITTRAEKTSQMFVAATRSCFIYRRMCPHYGCFPNTKDETYVVDFSDEKRLNCVALFNGDDWDEIRVLGSSYKTVLICMVIFFSILLIWLIVKVGLRCAHTNSKLPSELNETLFTPESSGKLQYEKLCVNDDHPVT